MDEWLSTVIVNRQDASDACYGELELAMSAVKRELGTPQSFYKPLVWIHYVPSTTPFGPHGLVFFLAHSMFDGIGVYQFMDLCANKIAEVLNSKRAAPTLAWGQEVARLTLPLPDCTQIPRTAAKIPDDRVMIERFRSTVEAMQVCFQ